jgi:hypothetical protein
MFIFLPDSPVSAPGLTPRERRVAVERLRGNQTGVENKHLKPYQVLEAFMDYKLYIFFMLGCVCNIPNGGISNFGTLIIKGFGFSTLVTTLMQVWLFSISALVPQILITEFPYRFPTASSSHSPSFSASTSTTASRTVAASSSYYSCSPISLAPLACALSH